MAGIEDNSDPRDLLLDRGVGDSNGGGAFGGMYDSDGGVGGHGDDDGDGIRHLSLSFS